MHMTSAPHLLTEDRPEFDRLVDEALRAAHERPELATLGERLNAEQLRTMAQGASALLAAAAAAEYGHYVKVREERRDEVLAPPGTTGTRTAPRTAVAAPASAPWSRSSRPSWRAPPC